MCLICPKGNVTISNDGATILKLLDVVHPAGKALVDVSRAQDAEVNSWFFLKKIVFFLILSRLEMEQPVSHYSRLNC